MATQEKVDVVIVGAGASGSVYAAVLAKAGKKVVVMDNGPDWQTSDLISSDIWGRRVKPAGAPFILEGKHPVSMGAPAGLMRRPQISEEMRSEVCHSGPLSITTTFLPALASTAA